MSFLKSDLEIAWFFIIISVFLHANIFDYFGVNESSTSKAPGLFQLSGDRLENTDLIGNPTGQPDSLTTRALDGCFIALSGMDNHLHGGILACAGIDCQFQCNLKAGWKSGNTDSLIRVDTRFIGCCKCTADIDQVFSRVVANIWINVGYFPHLEKNVQAGVAPEDVQGQFCGLGGVGGGSICENGCVGNCGSRCCSASKD